MNIILKYLKDQGGQFWGAFSQSYAKAVNESRDRPLKEAMMKAQIAHQQAVADKAQMDIEHQRQQQAALGELATVLQPQTVQTQAPASLPNEAAGEVSVPGAVTTETRMPDVRSPKVQAALIKAQPKEAATQLLKQSLQQQMGNAIVNSWEEARQLQNDPQFQAANPYGGRWIVNSKGQIQFQGIHPVNPEAALFHGPGGSQASLDYSFKRGASSSAGTYAGKTAQEAEEPIHPQVPFAGQQQPQAQVQPTVPATTTATPAPGAATPAARPGETQAQRVQRMRKEAQTAGSPIPEGLAKQQRDYVTLLNTTIADIEDNYDEKFLGARGVPGAQAYRESFLAPALEGITGISPSGSQEVVFRKALADASDMLLRSRSGAQINESEAKRLAKLLPAATDTPEAFLAGMARFKHQVQASIANGKFFANVTRSQLEAGAQPGRNPTPVPGKSQENIIHYQGKRYIKQNGALFEVRD